MPNISRTGSGFSLLPIGSSVLAKAKIVPAKDPHGVEDSIAITRGDLYPVHDLYTQARQAKDPLLAPHGSLRAMPYGDRGALLNFLRTFGPLEWHWEQEWTGPKVRAYAQTQAHAHEEPVAHVRVSEFWQQQANFVFVSSLWEAWNDPGQMQEAYMNLALQRERVSAETWARLVPFLKLASGLQKLVPHNRAMLWQQPEKAGLSEPFDFEKYVGSIRRQSAWGLRHWAAMLLKSELDTHTEGRQPEWEWHGSEEKQVGFSLVLRLESLWQAVWELFGADTAQPVGWRICPHCGKLFYPPRKDRFYCTPLQQALSAKRDWARRYRESQRQMLNATRRRD